MYEILSHRSKTYIHTIKFRTKAKVVIFFKGRSGGGPYNRGGYIRRGLYLEGNLRFKIVIIIWQYVHMCKTLPNIYKTQTNT